MLSSVLEAIKSGVWDFEPLSIDRDEFSATGALPGSHEKLAILAERVRQGLPLWHPSDRNDCENLSSEEAGPRRVPRGR